ncbi:hypothetical protein FACS189474_4290 [Bacteroidia bacterium]|nr:hypothetical protein FACS189474_4290 [Bacteroidia bacterium]
MFLLNFSDKTFRIGNVNLKKGDRVRVVKGPFMGIERELICIKGHKPVVVRLEGVFSFIYLESIWNGHIQRCEMIYIIDRVIIGMIF